jgi:DNA repair protein RadB
VVLKKYIERLKMGCKPLDNLIGGGLENGIITEFYGEAGSGKTNICIQASRECILNNIGKVVYIDTEGISVERIIQICQGVDYKKILSKILFFNPTSFLEQEKMISNSVKIKNIGLIVVDTINMFYRLMIEDDEEGANRSLIRQLTTLQLAARRKNLFVIITGQVYTAENGDLRPFAGRGIEHIAKTIVKLERLDMGKRRATIIKHRSQPEGKQAIFTITKNGLK